MARRYATKNAAMGTDTLFSVAHGLGKTPDGWAVNLRWSPNWTPAANDWQMPVAYIRGVSSANLRVRVARTTVANSTTPTGDLFAWVNHSIVK